jgi:hypothetical protein
VSPLFPLINARYAAVFMLVAQTEERSLNHKPFLRIIRFNGRNEHQLTLNKLPSLSVMQLLLADSGTYLVSNPGTGKGFSF